MYKVTLLFVLLVLGSADLCAEDKLTVYNHITKETEAVDHQVSTALAAKFHVIDLPATSDYVKPVVTGGDMPTEALSKTGEKLKGYVFLAYVITADGHADSPIVLKSTDERLNESAFAAVKTWRFTPAKYQGQPVATTAAQEFIFKGEISGFVVSNVVLYQTNDVLVARMPSAETLATYIKQLEVILMTHYKDAKVPEKLDVVIGVRPGNSAKVWFVSATHAANAKEFDEIRKQLEAIIPPDVKGQVVFAITGNIGGAKAAKEDGPFQPPIPQEWKDAAKKGDISPTTPDEYLDAAWPHR